MDKQAIMALIQKYAAWLGLPSDLAVAQAEAESSLDPLAASSAGAIGLFQVEPGTARSLLWDAEVSAFIGLFYLRRMYAALTIQSETDRWKLALASYNAGPGRVKEARAKAQAAGQDDTSFDLVRAYLPEETQKYVERIWSQYSHAMNPQG